MFRKIAMTGLILTLLVGGVGRAAQARNTASLKGTITLSGAFALYPMVQTWAEEFRKIHPEVKFDVTAGGAGKGITDALTAVVDVGMVSREIHDVEIKQGAWFVPVTKDAVVPVANAANPVWSEMGKRGLKKQTFAAIWIDESITTWEQALGRSGNTSITVYTRSDSCGAAETWALYLGKKQEDLAGVGVFADPGIAEAVRKDVRGIGFNNVNYAYDANTKRPVTGLRIIPIDLNGNGQIEPAENFYDTRDHLMKAIAEGRYPSPPARDLYFVTKGKPAKPILRAFIQWVLTEGQKYAPAAGYIPLAQGKLKDSLAKLK